MFVEHTGFTYPFNDIPYSITSMLSTITHLLLSLYSFIIII